jgi:hypothetical protein
MEKRGETRPLGALLKEVLKGVAPARTELQELAAAWERAAGADVAKRTRVVGVTRDTVTVSVESAALRQELESFREDELMGRLQREFTRRRIGKFRWVLKG